MAKVKIFDELQALINNSAKDDLVFDNGLPVTGNMLVANDPGSAKFYGIYDLTTHSFLLGDGVNLQNTTVDVSSFLNSGPTANHDLYSLIQTASGAFSLAHLQRGSYDFVDDFTTGLGNHGSQITAPDNGWVTGNVGVWQTLQGSQPVEVVGKGYVHFTNNVGGANDHNYVDTQSSPGGINIQTQVLTAQGPTVHDTLSVVLAEQLVVYNGNTYKTDPNATLELTFNGNLVHQFTAADFETIPGDASTIQYNTPKQFDFNVPDAHTGVALIGVHDTTAPGNNVGFALVQVDLHSHA